MCILLPFLCSNPEASTGIHPATEQGMTRLLLADDERVVRQGLRCLLEQEDDLQVVGETADGLEVPALVARLKPDVLITAVALPGLYGLEVTRRVHAHAPSTAVVILSRYQGEWYVTEALRHGALGYVVKHADVADLLRAVRTVARGRRYLSAPLSADSIDVWMRRAARATGDPYDTLTSREREVLQLVAEGFSSPATAGRLAISARTADSHRANVMRKLRLPSRAALISYALSRGVLAPAMATRRGPGGRPRRRLRSGRHAPP